MFSALLTFLETKGKLDDIIRRQKCVKGFKTDNILKIIKILTTEHFQTNVFNQTGRKQIKTGSVILYMTQEDISYKIKQEVTHYDTCCHQTQNKHLFTNIDQTQSVSCFLKAAERRAEET